MKELDKYYRRVSKLIINLIVATMSIIRVRSKFKVLKLIGNVSWMPALSELYRTVEYGVKLSLSAI